MKQNLTFFLILLSLIGCQHEKLNSDEPTDQDYLSINKNTHLQSIKSRLNSYGLVIANDRARNDENIIEQASWNKVRFIENETLDYNSYSMNVRLDNGCYSNDLIVFEQDGELFPYLLSFQPSKNWRSDLSFRIENPFDGDVQLTSLSTGKIWGNEEVEDADEGGRVGSTTCTTIWIEVNNNYVDSDGTVVVMPRTFYPVSICVTSGGDTGGDDGDFIDGIEAQAGGSESPNPGDDVIELATVEDTPCLGDPVPYPIVAEQKNSGIAGGMFGCTRNGSVCELSGISYPGKKYHGGIDLVNEYGSPIRAMYTGSIYTSFHSKSAGWFTRIQSTVNGKTIITEYFHMQENNRVTSGNVLAGQIIGYQGDSGNLKGAIEKGMTVSHVHIKIKEHDGSHESDYLKNFDPVDPRAYLKTIINDDGASIKDSDC